MVGRTSSAKPMAKIRFEGAPKRREAGAETFTSDDGFSKFTRTLSPALADSDAKLSVTVRQVAASYFETTVGQLRSKGPSRSPQRQPGPKHGYRNCTNG